MKSTRGATTSRATSTATSRERRCADRTGRRGCRRSPGLPGQHENLRRRFAPDYYANAEAATVLKHSTKIDQFMKGPSSPTKGRDSGMRVGGEPHAPGGRCPARRFPCRMGAVRRMNDQERRVRPPPWRPRPMRSSAPWTPTRPWRNRTGQALKTGVEAVLEQASRWSRGWRTESLRRLMGGP